MSSVEEIAIETYQKNLEYFSTSHKELYSLLNSFELALQNGSYSQKYDLEYMDNYFDVKEIQSSNYLYGQNSIEISKQLAQQVNFDKKDSSFEGVPVYYRAEDYVAKFEDIEEGMAGLYPIMKYYVDNTFTKNLHFMKQINKYLFLGTGLGLHIPLIDAKISASNYLIIEDNIELFKLSLFCTPYYKIAQNAILYFCVSQNNNLFLQTLNNFLQATLHENRFLKFTYFTPHSNKKIQTIQHVLSSNPSVIFPYKHSLTKAIRPLEYIHNGYRVLNISKHFNESVLSQKPLLLLGAGPSIQDNIEWLIKNQNRFIIFAISSTLKMLYKHNIKPDIVSNVDGFEPSLAHYADINAKEFLKESIIILGSFSHPNIRKLFNKKNVFHFQDLNEYFNDFGRAIGSCVGSYSTLLSLIFNSKEIYLLGLDLAVDADTGSTHAREHSFSKSVNMDTKDSISNEMGLRKNVFPVAGNFRDSVYTTSLFNLSIETLNTNIPNIKHKQQNIYNLSDGAKINDALAMDAMHIPLNEEIDKKALHADLLDTFNKHSSDTLSSNDITSIKAILKSALQTKQYLDQFSKATSFDDANSYIQQLLHLYINILKQTNNLSIIYMHYFAYLLPIVIDMFNTKDLSDTQKHIENLDRIIQKELYNIQNIYETALNDFVQNRL